MASPRRSTARCWRCCARSTTLSRNKRATFWREQWQAALTEGPNENPGANRGGRPMPAAPPKAPSIPGVKETVSLRIDRDVLDFFQDGGPGWQDRINAALRKAAGK